MPGLPSLLSPALLWPTVCVPPGLPPRPPHTHLTHTGGHREAGDPGVCVGAALLLRLAARVRRRLPRPRRRQVAAAPGPCPSALATAHPLTRPAPHRAPKRHLDGLGGLQQGPGRLWRRLLLRHIHSGAAPFPAATARLARAAAPHATMPRRWPGRRWPRPRPAPPVDCAACATGMPRLGASPAEGRPRRAAPAPAACLQSWNVWLDSTFTGPQGESGAITGVSATCSGEDQFTNVVEVGIYGSTRPPAARWPPSRPRGAAACRCRRPVRVCARLLPTPAGAAGTRRAQQQHHKRHGLSRCGRAVRGVHQQVGAAVDRKHAQRR